MLKASRHGATFSCLIVLGSLMIFAFFSLIRSAENASASELSPIASYAFDEGSGATAHDSTATHNATIHGAKWTEEGKYGAALKFDGENDILTIPSSPELEFSEAFTLEAWVRPQDSREFGAIITKETPGFYGYALESGGWAKGIPEGFISPEGSVEKSISGPEELPLNAWSHLAFTYDGEQMRLYVDGELAKTASTSGPQGGEGALQIGGSKLFGGYFKGLIDEVRVYDGALDGEEIGEDEESPVEAASAPELNPVASYAFDEGAGATAHDSAGDHDGSIHGAKWTEEGKYGDALEFDGGSDRVTVADSEDLQFTEGFTMEAWVNPSESHDYDSVMMKEDFGAGEEEMPYGYVFYAQGEEVPTAYIRKSGSGFKGIYGKESLPVNTWSHLTLTDDGEEMRLYVDGELVRETAAPPVTPSEGPLQIGANLMFSDYFKGRIDEVRLYDQALGSEEIEEGKETSIEAMPGPELAASYAFDEGSGTVAEDSTANHDGTIHGAKWNVAGKYGSDLEFDGENDILTIPSSPELEFSEAFTLEAWVRPQESKQFEAIITKETPSFFSYTLEAGGWKAGTPEGLISPEGSVEKSVTAPEELPANSWSHLALTYDGQQLYLYVNGELVKTAASAPPQGGEGPLQIGGAEVFSDYFDGRIDEVRIYDGALGGEEIAEDGETGIETPTGPIASDQPEVEGLREVTRSLVATDGVWTGEEPITFTYQWQRCATYTSGCADIAEATSKSYDLTTEDLSEHIRVVVHATDASGKGVATSLATAEISPSPPWFASDPTVDGEPEEGMDLTVNLDGLRGSKPQELTYEWQRCYLSCEVIGGATGDTYTATEADVAQMLRVKVTAENSAGEISHWTAPTAFVASAATTGAPVLSRPPLIGGLPRVTESMATEAGWSGEKPISTEIQWQRCNMAGELCETISGATEAVYELTEADEYSRLRTKITASNEEGSVSAYSSPSEYVHPADNTTFTLDPPVPLDELETAITESGARWLSLTFGGDTSGLFMVPSGSTSVSEEISALRGDDSSDLPVVSIELADSVPSEALSGLSENLSARDVGPSLRMATDGTTAEKREDEEEESFHEEFAHGAVEKAKLAGVSNTNKSTSADFNGTLGVRPGMDRLLYSKFWWHPTSGETFTDIYEIGSALAMEFDVKQLNHDNTDLAINLPGPFPPFQVSCLPWEENNFWIGTREFILIESTAPEDAGLYWDTGAEDPCHVKDLTYGFYHPEALASENETLVYFHGGDADGDVDASPLAWEIQILGELCDISPWCVNLPEDVDGVGTPIISDGAPYYPRFSAPPVLPYCYRYSNPLYKVEYPDLPGASPCIYVS